MATAMFITSHIYKWGIQAYVNQWQKCIANGGVYLENSVLQLKTHSPTVCVYCAAPLGSVVVSLVINIIFKASQKYLKKTK